MPENHDELPDDIRRDISPEEFDDELTERRYTDGRPAPIQEPPPADDDTDGLDVPLPDHLLSDDYSGDPDDVPFHLPRIGEDGSGPTVDNRNDPNKMVTMPHFREPGVEDYNKTLPGTGGLDPNPDMAPSSDSNADPSHKYQTVQNIRAVPPEPYRPPQQASIPAAESQHTMANPHLADERYQRPAQPANRGKAQGSYVPLPPQGKAQGQRKNALPAGAHRRKIMGLRPGCVYMFLGLVLTFCGGFTFLALGAFAIFVPQIEEQWTSQIDRVDDYRGFETTFIYDRYGNSLFESFSEGRRDGVPFERFPDDLINATVSIEDDGFWSNIGIDIAATTVATLNYFGSTSDDRPPGGSGITQQVVRNILFDFEKRSTVSVQRKAEEIILAIFLTGRKSKEDIITLYLNEIYYGNLAYGAQAAARTFFGKDVEDLTLGEAALLAGLPQAPSSLDPLNPAPEVQDRVFRRWRAVLTEMVEEGYITQQQMNQTLSTGLNFITPETSLRAPHFTVYAQNEFADILNELGIPSEVISAGGYRVYTTVDQEVNNIALGAARSQVASISARNNVSNAAVMVLKPLTGEIMGMVGSIDYNRDDIDGRVNVTTALRQPGSTMKPFTYAGAMELGMTAGDVIWDTRTSIGIPGQPSYEPVNYDRSFHGPMTMRTALANSYNIPAVQTLRLTGVDYLLNLMNRFGVETLGTDASRYGISLTLGGGELSLLEMSAAYGVFANQGVYVEPTSILCIVDRDDTILYQYENGCPEGAGRFTNQTVDQAGFGRQVLDPRIAYIMTDILNDNNARRLEIGTNSPLRTNGIESSAKTGTTDDFRDNWTMGYTRNVVVGVWVGNNDGQPMVNSSGLSGAAPIWGSVMTTIHTTPGILDSFRVGGQLLPDKPSPPSGMSLRQICNVGAMQSPATSCPQTQEWFLDGPAGIPDSAGNLQFPQAQPLNNNLAEGSSALLQEVSPDIYRALVQPIPPEVAAGISYNLQPGDLPPPPPRYCRVSREQAASATGAQELYFIAPPATSYNDSVEAERYAQANNIPFLPRIDCWAEVLTYTGGFGSPIVTAVIGSPANGQTLGNPVSIVGTVQFSPEQADFWHLDIIGGQWGDWTPMGQPGYQSVINGELFNGVLPPGSYRLRLRVQGPSGWVQTPYEIAFNVQ